MKEKILNFISLLGTILGIIEFFMVREYSIIQRLLILFMLLFFALIMQIWRIKLTRSKQIILSTMLFIVIAIMGWLVFCKLNADKDTYRIEEFHTGMGANELEFYDEIEETVTVELLSMYEGKNSYFAGIEGESTYFILNNELGIIQAWWLYNASDIANEDEIIAEIRNCLLVKFGEMSHIYPAEKAGDDVLYEWRTTDGNVVYLNISEEKNNITVSWFSKYFYFYGYNINDFLS